MNCPMCGINPAQKHPTFGILPCVTCQNKMNTNELPNRQVEFTSESIKTERKTHARSIIQPYRGETLSKEYLDMYGTKGISVTDKQIKKARNVWREDYSANFNLKKTK